MTEVGCRSGICPAVFCTLSSVSKESCSLGPSPV